MKALSLGNVFLQSTPNNFGSHTVLRLQDIVVYMFVSATIAKLLWSIRQCTCLVALVWILQLLILFQVELNQKLSRYYSFLYTSLTDVSYYQEHLQ